MINGNSKDVMETRTSLLNVPTSQVLIKKQFDSFVQNITNLKVSLQRLDDINRRFNLLKMGTSSNFYQNFVDLKRQNLSQKPKLISDFEIKKPDQAKVVENKIVKSKEAEKSSSSSSSLDSELDHDMPSQRNSKTSKHKRKASSSKRRKKSSSSKTSLPLQGSSISSIPNSDSSSSTPGGLPSLEEEFLESSFLVKSNFINVPPTINFVLVERKDANNFERYTRYLRWKMTPMTPKIIRNCLKTSGFKETEKSNLWLGCWGKSLKDKLLKDVKFYQKVSHFPGIFEIGRKDYLNRNLKNMKRTFGQNEFDFFPHTFFLPGDLKYFKADFHELTCKKWIIKPPASARGMGIFLINKLEDVPRKKKLIIQKYISNPYLINGTKFDLRIYIYVTCFDPLRIYMYKNGLARFATARYSNRKKNLDNKYIHLTNFSINKFNENFNSNQDTHTEANEHKWSLNYLWNYFERNNVNTTRLQEQIKDIVIKTIISCEKLVASRMNTLLRSSYCCHELLGFDILLDENLRLWLLEVNISPSLNSSTNVDVAIKSPLVKDILNTAGFRIPRPSDMKPKGIGEEDCSYSLKYCLDTRSSTRNRTSDEKAKQSYFCQLFTEHKSISSMVTSLTRCDVNVLVESIDERSRCGDLEVLFPSQQTTMYLKYFEQPRYYTLLLHEWFAKYPERESHGISVLNKLCKANVHASEHKPVNNSEV